jgi:hypothetical protein
MKKIVVVIAVLVSLFVVGVVLAQSVSYNSGFQVQNLENVTANIVVTFYRQDGTVAASNPYTIAASSSRTFFPISDVTAGFNGSVVISSDRNVRAVNNLLASGPANYFATTNGFQAGNTSVSLPLIMCNNGGFDTWFNVQNAGTADANITVNYVPGSNGTAQSDTAVIKPGAAKTFDQKTGSTTKNCAQLADGSGKFVGSASITSNQPIVAAVEQLNTGSFKVLMGYGGFTASSPSVALPLVMANNGGFYTGIQVQNAGGSSTTVTIAYSANTAGANNPVNEVFTLAAGASKTILQNGTAPGNGSVNNWSTLGKYVGSATVTNSGGQLLVAIVNQVRATPALGSAYEGFDPAVATNQASAPLIMANNSTYYTGIQVQNVDTGSVNVTITYGPNAAGAFAPAAEVFTLTPGSSKTILQSGSFPGNGSAVNSWGANKYVGSATITANGKVVAIVNQVSLSVSGDQFATGDAFNY